MNDRTNTIDVENKMELQWSIEPGLVCEKIRQDNDVIDCIVLVYVKTKTQLLEPIQHGAIYAKRKPSCCNRNDRVSFVTKTIQDNDVIDYVEAIYAKNNIELSWLIGLGADCDENQIG